MVRGWVWAWIRMGLGRCFDLLGELYDMMRVCSFFFLYGSSSSAMAFMAGYLKLLARAFWESSICVALFAVNNTSAQNQWS
ncbi:hypothetical protein BKA64DRAFT_688224 [Cadophora sp. MPI-SDFR-AT-0126]|nr:hypothetical protein BKA64DRAFT_688224 [Leotiomycetes sp. MPI-SDFR-AT-0126]